MCQAGHIRLHLYPALFAAVLIYFVPESSPPTSLLLLLCHLPLCPPSFTLPLSLFSPARISSGHGSLSQLQQGCVGTGYLSYYPAPTPLLKTQICKSTGTSVNIHTHKKGCLKISLRSHLKEKTDTVLF